MSYRRQENMDNIVHGYANESDEYIKPNIIKNLLSKEECDKIIQYSNDKLIDSEVVSGKDIKIRNSKQTWIKKDDVMIKDIIDRIVKQVGHNLENAEDLQVVRYGPDQYYNEHHDSCCDENGACKEFIKRGGQRILTVLIYLNEGFTDGETYFKNLNLKIKPNVGDAIVFHPLAKDSNKCHPHALHAGLPVTKGQKWIANLWFREMKFV
jgi:prolyl 4-hydroxylase